MYYNTNTLVVWYVSCWWVFLFTVIYLLVYGHQKNITVPVDGEEILLRILDTADEERYRTKDSYTYYYAKVSWSFECYIKDIQRT